MRTGSRRRPSASVAHVGSRAEASRVSSWGSWRAPGSGVSEWVAQYDSTANSAREHRTCPRNNRKTKGCAVVLGMGLIGIA